MYIIKMKQYILFVAPLYHFYADVYSLEYSKILYMFMCPYRHQYGKPADLL
jgi:hypothetical protein